MENLEENIHSHHSFTVTAQIHLHNQETTPNKYNRHKSVSH